MYINKYATCLLATALLSTSLYAQEVLIESKQIYEETPEPSRTATVVQINQTAQTNNRTVADILKDIPGVEVVRQGGSGQLTSVFIRGARSEATLVLVDGAEVNDALSPAAGFDFSAMTGDNIERIEVYRGPQSVRFGAGALGGVINIVTREGGRKSKTTYLTEAGSYSSGRIAVSTSGQAGILKYSLAGSVLSTEGFSAASENYGNTEADAARTAAASAKLTVEPSTTSKIEATFRHTNADVEIDSFGGTGGDDPDFKANTRQNSAGLSGSERFFSDQVKATAGLYFSEMDRKSENKPDAADPTDSADYFLSENKKAQIDIDWLIAENHTIKFGFSQREESGFNDSVFNGFSSDIPRKTQSVAGSSVTYLFDSPEWFFDAGARQDQSSKVGSISSARASLGRHMPSIDAKAFVSYGTGFKLPGLYQLYSSFGDETLKQEESTTLEASFEKKFAEKAWFVLTAFDNKYRDLVDYNTATNKYFNLSAAGSRGAEFQTTIQTDFAVQFQGAYTYLETRDESTGLRLLRRPQNSYSLTALFEQEKYSLNMKYLYRGEREDVDPGTFGRIKTRPYSLVNFGASYKFNDFFKIYARLENCFDEKYEEIAGYGTPRRSLYAGFSGEF